MDSSVDCCLYEMFELGPVDSSVVKRTGCASRGLGFCVQYPHGGSQPSVTSVLRDRMPTFGFCDHQACI